MRTLIEKYRIIGDNLEISSKWSFNNKFVIILGILLIASIISWLVIIDIIQVRNLEITTYYESKIKMQEELISEMADSLSSYNNDITIHKIHKIAGKYLITPDNSIPTETSVMKLALDCNAWYPDIILAQCILESNLGKSELSNKTNNLFGMNTISKSSITTQSGSHNNYSTYKNWQLSVIDRILMDHRYFKNKPTRNDYINKLVLNYSEDPEYLTKLSIIIDKLNKNS